MFICADSTADTVLTVVAVVIGMVIGGVLITVGGTYAVWRSLSVKDSAAAVEAFISPTSQIVEVTRQRWESIGRPTVARADLLTRKKTPKRWHWTPCGAKSPV